MNKILFCLSLFLLVGCGKEEKKSSAVFFAGEIVNPTSDHVVLYEGDIVLDSVKLDGNNRFAFELDSIDDGLYHFLHSPEYQYVFLERGDSLQIRLNTIDFDESLIFSGDGEGINNFLLELFLSNEKEKQTVYSSYTLEPKEFRGKIDSMRNEKLENLNNLVTETEVSEKAREIAKATIDYTYFTYMEEYPFMHKKYAHKKALEELPDDFYSYRENLDYKNSNFTYLRPYYNFMINHFGNLAYMSCSKKCGITDNTIKNKLHYNKHKLGLIDSLVSENELKDNLFRYVAYEYLLQTHGDWENNKKFIEAFHKLSGNNRHIEEIDDLYEGIKNIQPNNKIPDVQVVDVSGNKISLQEIAKGKKTVFYFWSGTERRHFEYMVKQVAKLSSKNPEYEFIGINVRTDIPQWKSMLESFELDTVNQYRSDNFDQLRRSLIINHMNKCIIADDAVIVDAFASMYDPSLKKDKQ